MVGCEISSLEQRMCSLPVCFGDPGVDLPVTSADSMYAAFRHATGILVDAIIAGSPLEPCVHEDLTLVARDTIRSSSTQNMMLSFQPFA